MTREEAIQVLANFYVSTKNPKANHLCEAVYIAIQALKVESKPMHWIDTAECRFKYSMDSRFRCSVCGKGYDFKHRFCPNCGKKADNPSGVFLKAKMDGKEDNNG